MKKIITILSVSLFAFAFATSVSAATPNWDITGTWTWLQYDCPLCSNYATHDMIIAVGDFDVCTGDFSGTGVQISDPTNTWTVLGNVDGNDIEFQLVTDLGSHYAGYILDAAGTIALDGTTMAGSGNDNYGRTTPWEAYGVTAVAADCDNDGSPNNLDCNDNDATIYPGAPDAACNGVDNDCDTAIDKDYVDTPTSCGVGGCAATGEMTCVSGVEVDSCVAESPTEEVYDGNDNNCNGQTDEGFCTDPNTAKQLLETVTVNPDGTTYLSNSSLKLGEEYIIEANGTYDYGPSIADAKCSERTGVIYGPGWVPGELLPAPWQYFLQIWVNGTHVSDNWGDICKTDHEYITSYTGAGSQIGFSIIDSGYGDNSGNLSADIYYCNPDKDGDGYNYDVDCNDDDLAINPGATEVCNYGQTKVDENCDGQVDEDACAISCTPTADSEFALFGQAANRSKYISESNFFKTVSPKGRIESSKSFSIDATNGCNCTEILTWLQKYDSDMYGNMEGHWKYGCSISVMNEFIRITVPQPSYTVGDVGFRSPYGNVELDFSAYETVPATGEVNWARVTGSTNWWNGPVIWTDVTDASTAYFTVRVDAGTPPAVLGCDITFKVIEGGIGVGLVQITAVVDDPFIPGICGAVGQVQGPWTINAGEIQVYSF